MIATTLASTACSGSEEEPAPVEGALSCTAVSARDLLPDTGAYFGVSLDWGRQSISQFASTMGIQPAVAVSFVKMPLDAAAEANVRAAGQQVRAVGGILLLTLEPHDGLETVTPIAIERFAKLAAELNDAGVPVVVRFAHEMNGSWYTWGQKPAEYVDTFRRLAASLSETAPATEMMWTPNYGGGYPFTGGAHEATPGSSQAAALDTDGDGVLTQADDPYAPYYPGDDVVDWVGISLYHWGAAYPWGENTLPEAGKFADQLTGAYDGTAGDETLVPDFYQIYAEEHRKPLAITETAALVTAGTDVGVELPIKQAWWRQVLDPEMSRRFPQLRMINWFDWEKEEVEVGGRVDWTVSNHPEVQRAFLSDLPDWVITAEDLHTCAATTHLEGHRSSNSST